MKILIVDDNVDAAEVLAMALEVHGHQTRSAHNGAGALSEFAEWSPDTVLLDLGLPDFDGYEVARRMRAHDSQPVIIALTGQADINPARSEEAGFACHLVKPVTLDQLDETIARIAKK